MKFEYKLFYKHEDSPELERLLNEYGADGWCLIHIHFDGMYATCVMERQPSAGPATTTADYAATVEREFGRLLDKGNHD